MTNEWIMKIWIINQCGLDFVYVKCHEITFVNWRYVNQTYLFSHACWCVLFVWSILSSLYSNILFNSFAVYSGSLFLLARQFSEKGFEPHCINKGAIQIKLKWLTDWCSEPFYRMEKNNLHKVKSRLIPEPCTMLVNSYRQQTVLFYRKSTATTYHSLKHRTDCSHLRCYKLHPCLISQGFLTQSLEPNCGYWLSWQSDHMKPV